MFWVMAGEIRTKKTDSKAWSIKGHHNPASICWPSSADHTFFCKFSPLPLLPLALRIHNDKHPTLYGPTNNNGRSEGAAPRVGMATGRVFGGIDFHLRAARTIRAHASASEAAL
jgi:hypothetical protein